MDVKFWIKTCQSCGARKPPKNVKKAPLIPIPVSQPFERVHVDILGPLPLTKTGCRYILIFVDSFTKWVEAFATPSIEASVIANIFYRDIICRFGSPRTILSDRGKQFDCALFREICLLVNTTPLLTSGYHPQTNGLVERFNSTLLASISMYVSSHRQDWCCFLHGLIHAYRCSIHPATKESPFYLVFGREPCLPVDTRLLPPGPAHKSIEKYRAELVENVRISQSQALINLRKAALTMKEQYDIKSSPTKFREGDKVYVYNPPTTKIERKQNRKLQLCYHGPYRLSEQLSPVHFRLSTIQNEPLKKTVHVNRLKPYFDAVDWKPNFPILPQEEEDEMNNLANEGIDETMDENYFLAKEDLQPPVANSSSAANHTESTEGTTIISTTNEKLKNKANVRKENDYVINIEDNKNGDTDNEAPHAKEILPNINLKEETTTDKLSGYHVHSSSETSKDDDIYQAEYIIKHRSRKGEIQYLIKWAGYDAKDSTWEGASSILDPALLEHYKRKSSKPTRGSSQAISAFRYCITILLIAFKFSLCFSIKKRPTIGPLFDCSQTKNLGVFSYPEPIACSHSLWAKPFTSLANIYHYSPGEKIITITLCSAYTLSYQCNENFFGAKEKMVPVRKQTRTTNHECLNALITKKSPFGPLKALKKNRWSTTDSNHYVCGWLQHKKHIVHQYKMSHYSATLHADDPILHQPLTISQCNFNNSFNKLYAYCTPSENNLDTIIWKKPLSLPVSYRPLGPHKVIKLHLFYLIPSLGVGGAIQSSGNNNTVLLDTGYIISDLKQTQIPYKFFRKALRFVSSGPSSYKRDVLEAHLSQNLYQQSALFSAITSQLCKSQQQIAKLNTFLLTALPDLAGEYIFSKPGFSLIPRGDGFSVHKCNTRLDYIVLWNRTHANQRFNDIPILIGDDKILKFITFPLREIVNYSKPLNISHQPPLLVFKDERGQHWTLYPNSSIINTKPSTKTRLPNINAPRIHRFNRELLHYTHTNVPRLSLLGIVEDSTDILSQLNDIRDNTNDGSFSDGFTNFIDKTISTLASGGGTLVSSIGNAIKEDLEGTSDVISSTADGAGEIIKETGISIKKILSFTGPTSLIISLLIVGYLIFRIIQEKKKVREKRVSFCHCDTIPEMVPTNSMITNFRESTNTISPPLQVVQSFTSKNPIPLTILPMYSTPSNKGKK